MPPDLRLGFAEHDEVVGVAHEAIAGRVELPVEAVESDVGEQGRNDAPGGVPIEVSPYKIKIHHERTKSRKKTRTAIILCLFRDFVLSCFRDGLGL